MKKFSFYLIALTASTVAHLHGGVPSVDPDYGQDVRDWWQRHPMNAQSTNAVREIAPVEPVIDLPAGSSIDDAVAKLPATGGTLRLAAGKYAPFRIVGRSHVHLIGPDQGVAVVTGRSVIAVCEEALDYVKFDVAVSHFDTVRHKDAKVWEAYRKPSSDFHLKNLVFDGEGVTTVDFPGMGIQGKGGALGLRGVRDVVVDRCVFRGYLDERTGLQHGGLAWGHYGLTNVWFRDCHFIGTARYAVYLDGAHGSGLLGCTIEGTGCKDGGLLFLANHDFTDDRNENGKIDADEEKCAKYLVISGNTFAGNFSTPVRLTGQKFLIAGNTANGRMLELAGIYPTGEIARRTWTYGDLGVRVTGNTLGVCARGVLNVFLPTKAQVEEMERTPASGRYTVEGNTVIKSPADVLATAMKP